MKFRGILFQRILESTTCRDPTAPKLACHTHKIRRSLPFFSGTSCLKYHWLIWINRCKVKGGICKWEEIQLLFYSWPVNYIIHIKGYHNHGINTFAQNLFSLTMSKLMTYAHNLTFLGSCGSLQLLIFPYLHSLQQFLQISWS